MSDFGRRRCPPLGRATVCDALRRLAGGHRGGGCGGGRRVTRVRVQNVVRKGHVTVAAALQRDRLRTEMLEHLVYGLEPEVLHATLALVVDGHAQMLRAPLKQSTTMSYCCSCCCCSRVTVTHLEVERQHELSSSSFALSHQKATVSGGSVVQHLLGGLRSAQRAVEPQLLLQCLSDIRFHRYKHNINENIKSTRVRND